MDSRSNVPRISATCRNRAPLLSLGNDAFDDNKGEWRRQPTLCRSLCKCIDFHQYSTIASCASSGNTSSSGQSSSHTSGRLSPEAIAAFWNWQLRSAELHDQMIDAEMKSQECIFELWSDEKEPV